MKTAAHPMSWVAAVVFSCAALAACASSSPSGNPTPPAAGNGVDDVAQACAIRAQWKNASGGVCTQCMGLAITPHCDCETEDYASRCHAQQEALNAEPTCDGVAGCIGNCTASDCACIDACYAGKPACRTAASAVDGCVAEVCDPYCR